MTLEELLKSLIKLLQREQIRFALAGGLAASLYREEERFTKDIDLVTDVDEGQLKILREILNELKLTPHFVRKAELDGGPLFAIKRKSSPIALVAGRDKQKDIPGVDFLLRSNLWVPLALERAQSNVIDWGIAKIPSLAVEDMIVCKLISSHHSEREQDIIDLRGIFRATKDCDLIYIISRMKELSITVAKSVEKFVPYELLRASKRIARVKRR
jgi:hypothetical protein